MTTLPPDGPLIIQSDRTLMLETAHPLYGPCRDFLALFAELVKSPEYIHTYKVSPLSMWNAAALDIPFETILEGLHRFSRYEPPGNVLSDIKEWYGVYGQLVLIKESPDLLRLQVFDKVILHRISQNEDLAGFWKESVKDGWLVETDQRGNVKQALVKAGYPVKDLCGYVTGDALALALKDVDTSGTTFCTSGLSGRSRGYFLPGRAVLRGKRYHCPALWFRKNHYRAGGYFQNCRAYIDHFHQ